MFYLIVSVITRQHELDPTDQGSLLPPEISAAGHELGIACLILLSDDVGDMCGVAALVSLGRQMGVEYLIVLTGAMDDKSRCCCPERCRI